MTLQERLGQRRFVNKDKTPSGLDLRKATLWSVGKRFGWRSRVGERWEGEVITKSHCDQRQVDRRPRCEAR